MLHSCRHRLVVEVWACELLPVLLLYLPVLLPLLCVWDCCQFESPPSIGIKPSLCLLCGVCQCPLLLLLLKIPLCTGIKSFACCAQCCCLEMPLVRQSSATMKGFRQLLLIECCNADTVHCWSNLLLRTRSCMLPNCCLNSWLKLTPGLACWTTYPRNVWSVGTMLILSMYVCMYVCMYVSMYVCKYTFISHHTTTCPFQKAPPSILHPRLLELLGAEAPEIRVDLQRRKATARSASERGCGVANSSYS